MIVPILSFLFTVLIHGRVRHNEVYAKNIPGPSVDLSSSNDLSVIDLRLRIDVVVTPMDLSSPTACLSMVTLGEIRHPYSRSAFSCDPAGLLAYLILDTFPLCSSGSCENTSGLSCVPSSGICQ